MIKAMDCGIVVSEFVLQSRYYVNRLIGLVGRLFVNDLGDLGSIPGRIIPKTLKMVLDTSLLNTLQYKVCIKQSRERSSYWKV